MSNPLFPECPSPNNLEKDTSFILAASEIVITEKIHGTSIRVGLSFDDQQQPVYRYGKHHTLGSPTEENPHGWFFHQLELNGYLKRTLANLTGFLTNRAYESGMIIYGELFGCNSEYGKIGEYGPKYSPKRYEFRVFDVAIKHGEGQ